MCGRYITRHVFVVKDASGAPRRRRIDPSATVGDELHTVCGSGTAAAIACGSKIAEVGIGHRADGGDAAGAGTDLRGVCES